jgi:hypothetical protein
VSRSAPASSPTIWFTLGLAVVLACLPLRIAASSPALVSADIRVTVTSPTSCDVTMLLRVEGASDVAHRIESFDGAVILLDEVRGAQAMSGPETIGRTRAVRLRLDQAEYALRYRAEQGSRRRDRCPLWVPAIPSTGRLGAIGIEVRLPDGSRPAASMPALTWSGSIGTTALAHVPAFVRVAFATPGEPTPLDLPRMMDALAVVVFAAASGVWLWRRRRRAWA